MTILFLIPRGLVVRIDGFHIRKNPAGPCSIYALYMFRHAVGLALQLHQLRMHPTSYECTLCGLDMEARDYIISHIETYHQVTVEP
jgi:hypothetical protein